MHEYHSSISRTKYGTPPPSPDDYTNPLNCLSPRPSLRRQCSHPSHLRIGTGLPPEACKVCARMGKFAGLVSAQHPLPRKRSYNSLTETRPWDVLLSPRRIKLERRIISEIEKDSKSGENTSSSDSNRMVSPGNCPTNPLLGKCGNHSMTSLLDSSL